MLLVNCQKELPKLYITLRPTQNSVSESLHSSKVCIMSKPVDLELKQAFMELQFKMIETSKKIQVIDSQISVLQRVLQHADITQREISTLPSGTKTYESVGRMFILTDLDEIKGNLKDRISLLTTRTTDLKSNKSYLENNLKESEDNIREMVQQRRDQNEVKP